MQRIPAMQQAGSVVKKDLLSTYSAHMRKMIIKQVAGGADRQRPLAGLKIVVDAGNGAGGFYARDILAPLGADISGSRFLEPDGMFPVMNQIPKTKKPWNLSDRLLSKTKPISV